MKVGFIGLGIMGKPMCKNLMKAGYEMVVTTHNKETLKEMEALGAKTVTCGREVAEEADVIITMLPNSPQVREVALGEVTGVQTCALPILHLAKAESSRAAKKEVS